MRAPLILFVCGSCLLLLQRNPEPATPAVKMLVQRLDSINFKAQVEPIFQKHCNPCHFPGGKMYEKLPFDQGTTIISRQAGILRRIKEEDEVRLIKQYLEQNRD